MVAGRDATSPAATAAPSSSAPGARGPGESLPRQEIREGEPAAGLGGADPQPCPQELRGGSGTRRPRPSGESRQPPKIRTAPRHPRHCRCRIRTRLTPPGPDAPPRGRVIGPVLPSAGSPRTGGHAVSPSAAAAPDASRSGGAVGGVVPPSGGPRRVRFRGGGGLFPGPVHGIGRHELQVVQGPRELLDRAGEIRRLPEVPHGGVPAAVDATSRTSARAVSTP